MIFSTTIIIFTILLLIFTLLDIKSRAIPSVLLTATLFFLAFLRFANIKWAVLFGIFALMMWEFADSNQVSFGVADIKVMIMFGFFIPSMFGAFAFLIAYAVGQVFYIYGMRKFTKLKEVPFIPLFFAIWIGGLIGGLWI
jgi:hypothetical protein